MRIATKLCVSFYAVAISTSKKTLLAAPALSNCLNRFASKNQQIINYIIPRGTGIANREARSMLLSALAGGMGPTLQYVMALVEFQKIGHLLAGISR